MLDTFSDILRPMPPEEFSRSYHGKKPVHIPGTPDKLASVMDRQTLSGLLGQTDLWPSRLLQVVVDTHILDPQEYCRPGLDREGRNVLLADPHKIREWVSYGASLVLNAVASLTPGLRAVTGAIEQGTGGKAGVNVYLSQASHQAFGSHFDCHDVYALQAEGTKTWRIYQRHFEDPIVHPSFKSLGQDFHEAHKGEVSLEVMLNPGDVLYIPRGWYHDAVASSPVSIHVTIGVNHVVGLDLMQSLYQRAVQDPLFRRTVPVDDAALDRHMEQLGVRLAEYVRESGIRSEARAILSGYGQRRITGDVLAGVPSDNTAQEHQRCEVERHPSRDQL